MGIDSVFYAVPEDWPFLQEARTNVEITDYFWSLSPWLSKGPGPDSELEARIRTEVQQLFTHYPGLEERCYFQLYRAWDALHYLLSPAVRANEKDEDSLIKKALYGYEYLNPNYVSSEGYNLPTGLVRTHQVPIKSCMSTMTHRS